MCVWRCGWYFLPRISVCVCVDAPCQLRLPHTNTRTHTGGGSWSERRKRMNMGLVIQQTCYNQIHHLHITPDYHMSYSRALCTNWTHCISFWSINVVDKQCQTSQECYGESQNRSMNCCMQREYKPVITFPPDLQCWSTNTLIYILKLLANELVLTIDLMLGICTTMGDIFTLMENS